MVQGLVVIVRYHDATGRITSRHRIEEHELLPVRSNCKIGKGSDFGKARCLEAFISERLVVN